MVIQNISLEIVQRNVVLVQKPKLMEGNEEAESSRSCLRYNAVSGTLTLFYRDTMALFDYDTTHSFISCAFAYHTNKPINPLEYHLFVCLKVYYPLFQ